jgi:hypothetical protein
MAAMRLTPKRDLNQEARAQAAIVDFIRTVAPQCLCIHIPMGGLRTKSEAAKLKWMGAMAGVPDLLLVDEHSLCYFIEIKGLEGRLSESQLAFRELCRARGWPWGICRSIEDARNFLARWKIVNREVKNGETEAATQRRIPAN